MTEQELIAGIIAAIQSGNIWLLFYWIVQVLIYVGMI